jgi:hypothetical protein
LDQLLVAADQAMYRAKSSHKLDKISQRATPPAEISELENDNLVELENDNLASVSVNS